MNKVKWYSVVTEGLPKPIDTDLTKDLLLCVESRGVRYVSVGFYSHYENLWCTQNGENILGRITHWADAPLLPEVD